MNSVDGDVRLSVKLDTKTVQASASELKEAIKSALTGMSGQSTAIDTAAQNLSKTVQNVARTSTTFGNSFSAAKVKVDATASTALQLANNIQIAENKVADLNRQIEVLSKQKSPAEEYRELTKYLEQAEKDLEAENQKHLVLRATVDRSSAAWKENVDEINAIKQAIAETKAEMQELEKSGEAFKIIDNSEKLTKLNEQLTVAKNQLEIAKVKQEEFNNAIAQTDTATNALENATTQMQDVQQTSEKLTISDKFNSIATTINTASNKITNFNHKIIESIKNLIKHATASKTAKNSLDNFNNIIKKGIGFILKYGLGIRSTYILINKLRTAVKEGYKNLAGYSDEVNDSISSVLSSTAKLKNQLAAAFQPIVSVVVPVLNQLIDKLNESAVKISKFFAAWTGQEVVYTANNIQKKYVDNLEDTAKAAEESEKALNGYLSPLDDINRYEERTTSKADEKNKDVTDYSKMFNTVAVDSQFKTLVAKIKSYLNQLFEPIKKSWEKYGGETVQKVKGTFESLLKTINSVHDSFLTVWTGGTGESIVDNILKTFININTIITNISENFRTAWDTGVGLSIVEKIAGIFETILTHITNITQKTAKWSSSVNFEPLLTALNGVLTPLKGIFDLAGKWAEKVWEKVFLPLASWAIEEAVPAALGAIGGALALIKAVGEKAGKWLGIIWDNFLSKVAKFIGDKIVNFLTVLGQTLKDVSKNETAVTVLTAVGAAILTIVAGIQIFNVALTAIAALQAINPFTWILIALAAIVVVIVEVITYWDTLKQAWQDGIKDLKKRFPATVKFIEETITNIKTIFKGIIKFISGVFTRDWKKTWDGVKTIFKGIFDSMVTIVKTPINLIISMINSMIQGVANKINIVAAFLNSFGVDIPDWVPGIGGGHLSFNIPYMEAPQIPLLAQGAVIPPNREFLAVLGDQKQGKNIETPESLLRQIMREELNGNNANVYNVSAKVRQKTLFDVVIDEARLRQGQTGRNPFNLT